jgi:hypothetical protein
MAIDKKINYKDKRLTKAQQKKTKPVNQGGGPNYLGKQETATVPKKWLSSPDHVVAELAYITPREQKILLDANIYGSLKGKPNKGPGGIMSLQGDLGGYSGGTGGTSSGKGSGDTGQGKGGRSTEDYKNTDYYKMMTGTGTTATSSGGDTYRSGNLYETPEMSFNTTTGKNEYIGGGQKFVSNPSLLSRIFGGTNKYGYRDIQNTKPGSGIFGTNYFGDEDITYNPVTQQYEHSGLKTGDVKPSRGGQILGGLASIATGIPFVGSAIGSAIDRFKPKSYMEKQTPEEISRMKGLQMINGELVDTRMLDFDPNARIQDTSFEQGTTPNTYTEGSIPFNPGMTVGYGTGITQTEPFGNPERFTNDLAPEFRDMAVNIGINDAQKSLINQAINNAKLSDTKIPAGIYDQAKELDTKAESGFLGIGKKEADPMTEQEYKNYLVSQGYNI